MMPIYKMKKENSLINNKSSKTAATQNARSKISPVPEKYPLNCSISETKAKIIIETIWGVGYRIIEKKQK